MTVHEKKWTPGSWNAYPEDIGLIEAGRSAYSTVDDENGRTVAYALAYHNGRDIEAHAANAHLIASAPELLTALKLMLDSHDRTCAGEDCQISGVDIARAAVAKAEGRTND